MHKLYLMQTTCLIIQWKTQHYQFIQTTAGLCGSPLATHMQFQFLPDLLGTPTKQNTLSQNTETQDMLGSNNQILSIHEMKCLGKNN